jgi:hypothetical protein
MLFEPLYLQVRTRTRSCSPIFCLFSVRCSSGYAPYLACFDNRWYYEAVVLVLYIDHRSQALEKPRLRGCLSNEDVRDRVQHHWRIDGYVDGSEFG